MKSRLQKSFSVLSVLSLLVVASCEMPPTAQKKDAPFDVISGYQYILSYSDTLSALLRHSGSIVMEPGNVNTKLAVAEAVFMDSTLTTQVDPSATSCNGYTLTRNANEITHSQGNQGLYVGQSNASWVITGYEGHNYGFSDALPSDLVITNLSAGDTVSKSAGFTVNYTGNAGGDLGMVAYYDAGFTRFYVNSGEAWNGGTGEYHAATPDDGSVTFSSSNLSSFSTGDMIRVVLTHWKYSKHTATNNRKIGSIRATSVEIPLYLAP